MAGSNGEVSGMSEDNEVVNTNDWQGKPYEEEVKIEVAGRLMGGEKPIDLSIEYGMSLPTISRIKKKYINSDMLAKMEEEKQAVLEDLLLLGLEHSIAATVNIARVTEDEGWLKKQTAGDLGKMYGILSDKIARVAEAREEATAFNGVKGPAQELGGEAQ